MSYIYIFLKYIIFIQLYSDIERKYYLASQENIQTGYCSIVKKSGLSIQTY